MTLDTSDTTRSEALRSTLEAEREAWSKERRKYLAALAKARLENRRLRRKLEGDDGTD